MCRKVTCEQCGKPTWAGCGKHVDMALAGVPEEERCHHKPWTQALQDKEEAASLDAHELLSICATAGAPKAGAVIAGAAAPSQELLPARSLCSELADGWRSREQGTAGRRAAASWLLVSRLDVRDSRRSNSRRSC